MWEQRYGADTYIYGTEPNDFLRDQIHSLPDGPVLCLAEGEGRNAVFVAATGREVHSVDLTESGVAKTRRLAQERGVSVNAVMADLATHDIGDERWGAVVSIFAHMPPHVRRDLHARVVAALRPGGVLLLEAYTPDQIGRGTGGPAVAEMTMSLDLLREELEGLEFLHALETERVVVEGAGHTGVGAVVQVIARKPG
ncbi:MAG: class I SAM-dependent methyltransferase [Actinobacteria bacterium]|nr:class I SAM-dependent methyltransferase [Actinomycetota bacterium]